MKKSILFIEDEFYTIAGIANALSEMYDWQLARSGSEAHERLSRRKFDLVVLDIMMPHGEEIDSSVPGKGTGIEILRMIREGKYEKEGGANSQVSVIVLTAIGEMPAWEEIDRLGVNQAFTKPVKYAEFKNAVSECLEETKS